MEFYLRLERMLNPIINVKKNRNTVLDAFDEEIDFWKSRKDRTNNAKEAEVLDRRVRKLIDLKLNFKKFQ